MATAPQTPEDRAGLRTVASAEIEGIEIRMLVSVNTWAVVYGMQVKTFATGPEAATEFRQAMAHAFAIAGYLDDGER